MLSRFIAGIVLLLSCVTSAFACSCYSPRALVHTARGVAEAYIQTAPVIFEGKVEKVELRGWPLKPEPGKTVSRTPTGMLVTFSGVRVYRGGSREQFTIQTGLGGGDCGYRFESGDSYLVYAYTDAAGNLGTGICSGTERLEQAGAALRVLRGETATASDLTDIRDEATDSRSTDPNLCAKLSFPADATVTDVRVYLWRAEENANPLPIAQVDREEDGSQCVGFLRPGKYLMEPADYNADVPAYASYYPGVLDRAKAKPIVIAENNATVHIDFPVLRQLFHTVRGYVRGTRPAGNIQVMLQTSGPDLLQTVRPEYVHTDGSFEFLKVPEGSYSVFAFSINDDHYSITFLSEAIELDVLDNVEGASLQFFPKP